MLIAIATGYPIYFGFAMKLNPPFNFPRGLNSSTIIKDYVFQNNIGLALFVLTMIVVLMILWEIPGKMLARRVKRNFNPNIPVHPLIKRFGRWYLILLDDEFFFMSTELKLDFFIRIIVAIVAILCVAYLIYDLKDTYNLISLIGLFVFILLCIFLSQHPSRVNCVFNTLILT